MNRTRILRSAMLVAAIACAVTTAHASAKREISLKASTLLAEQSIPPGNYALGWEEKESPNEVEITIRSGKRVIGRADGKQVQLDSPSPYDALVYAPADSGAMRLVEIRSAGTKWAIRVNASSLASTEPEAAASASR